MIKISDLDNSELLQFISQNGIIDLAHIREEIEMNKRKEILKTHPYSIWEGKDGYWHTYLPSADGQRKPVKKKLEKDIKDTVVDYWKAKTLYDFKSRYEIWMERQRKCGRSDNTIGKYESDYLRFFAGDEFEKKSVVDITDEHIADFINRLLERKAIPYRALKGMYGYMNGVFEKCIIDKIIDKNPCRYIDLPMFKKKCTEPRRKTAQERTLSVEEKKILLRKLDQTKIDDPSNVIVYAVELSLYTGMRVGELVALKWEDIDYDANTVTICRSEKCDRKKKEFYISSTKNDKVRIIPLTEEMKDVFLQVKKTELRYGYLGEYVFQNDSGRIHAPKVSWLVESKTKSKDFTGTKSIHAIRRTLNSNLICMGVPRTVAASILGHSEEVNEKNYTYDVSTYEQKYEYIKQAGKIS